MKKTADDLEYEVLIANVREVMKTRQGKDVIWHILGMCELYSHNYAADPHTEGKRSLGLGILQMLEDADPTLYARLLLAKIKQNEGQKQND